MNIEPNKGKLLVEVVPYNCKPGLVMNDRDEKPYKGIIKNIGEGVDEKRLGQTAYFRYHFGFSIPETEPEEMIIDLENVECFGKE